MHLRKILRASLLVLGCGAALSLAAQENASPTAAKPPSIRHTTHATHASSAPKSAAETADATGHGKTVWQSSQAGTSATSASPDKADAGLTGLGQTGAGPDSGASVGDSASALKKPY